MHRTLASKLNHALERAFPEQRLFLRSDEGTRFIRLSPLTQALAWTGSATLVAWAIIATAILMMDTIGAGSIRDQAAREQKLYEARLRALASERDTRAQEAAQAQARFNLALEHVSQMQGALLALEERRSELERGIGVIQTTLRRTMAERDEARTALATMARAQSAKEHKPATPATTNRAFDMLVAALDTTAGERDNHAAAARAAETFAEELLAEQKLAQARNEQIFRKLEDAVSISLEPLDKMFRRAGLSPDEILDQVRKGYSGQGGPLTPLIVSTKGALPDPDALRANQILAALDKMNLYRIAIDKIPFANPVKGRYRLTSAFGPRWGRKHEGLDMAGATGTPILAPADGVVTFAGWASGYGKHIRIRHANGIETRYGHLSAIRVKKGQRVSRGDRIGDMGNTGRSTGPHLHYEIRVGGKAINPMIYLKAAQDVL